MSSLLEACMQSSNGVALKHDPQLGCALGFFHCEIRLGLGDDWRWATSEEKMLLDPLSGWTPQYPPVPRRDDDGHP